MARGVGDPESTGRGGQQWLLRPDASSLGSRPLGVWPFVTVCPWNVVIRVTPRWRTSSRSGGIQVTICKFSESVAFSGMGPVFQISVCQRESVHLGARVGPAKPPGALPLRTNTSRRLDSFMTECNPCDNVCASAV